LGPDLWRIIGSTIVSFLLSMMLMRAWLPFAPRRPGEVQLEVPLGFLQRVLVHRNQAILLVAYVLLSRLPGSDWLLPGTEYVALAGLAVILMIPMRYVFTDRAVGINNTVPRPYRHFRKFEFRRDVRQGKRWLANNVTIFLRGRKTDKGTFQSHTLFVPLSARDDVLHVLKRHVR
jgi:hypothetical protein